MRDLIAALVALGLIVVAASLATTLQAYRRRRNRARESERALGRTIIAEIPAADDLVLFSEDPVRFHYGERSIDKDLIVSARLLINAIPVATVVSRRPGRSRPSSGEAPARAPAATERGADLAATAIEDRPEGIARDRWDVAIDTVQEDTVIVECGAIRERVSQELARAVYDAVKREVQRLDGG